MEKIKFLTKENMKKIIGGVIRDDSFAGCSKDCGDNRSVTCSGTSCTTTETGCYAQNSSGGVDFQYC